MYITIPVPLASLLEQAGVPFEPTRFVPGTEARLCVEVEYGSEVKRMGFMCKVPTPGGMGEAVYTVVTFEHPHVSFTSPLEDFEPW